MPTCTEMMEHSTRSTGTYVTLETLLIDAGYWRATNGSIIVLACYNKGACQGGLTGSNDFCKKGYKGPCKTYRKVLLVVHANNLVRMHPWPRGFYVTGLFFFQ